MLKLGCNYKGSQTLPFSLRHVFQRLLLYSSTSSLPEQPTSLASYLVASLGFSHQQSLATSAKLTRTRKAQGATKTSDFSYIDNANDVIRFFDQLGFDRIHLRKIVSSIPKVLLSDVDKTLKPKIEVFQELGISVPDLVSIISRKPVILLRSLNSTILPAIKTLREILNNDESVIKFIKRSWGKSEIGTIRFYLVDNFNLLINYGIPVDLIRKHLVQSPALVLRKEQLEASLIRAEEKLGIPRKSRMFLYGVQLLLSCNERTIESKCEVFKTFGWEESDIKTMIRTQPYSLIVSKERIKKSLDFLMGELGRQPAYLAANPCLIMCSLEKRVMPRYRLMLVLKEKGLIKKEYALTTITYMIEAKFLEKFVLPFEEVHQVYSEYTGRPVPLLTQGKALLTQEKAKARS